MFTIHFMTVISIHLSACMHCPAGCLCDVLGSCLHGFYYFSYVCKTGSFMVMKRASAFFSKKKKVNLCLLCVHIFIYVNMNK